MKKKSGKQKTSQSKTALDVAFEALGHGNGVDKLNLDRTVDDILEAAMGLIQKGYGASAYASLLELRRGDKTLPLVGKQVWRFCEATLYVAAYCKEPRLLLRLVHSWLEELQREQDWPEYFRAVVLVLETLDVMIDNDLATNLLDAAVVIIHRHSLGPTAGGICVMVQYAKHKVKVREFKDALACYEIALTYCQTMPDCPVFLRVRVRLDMSRAQRQLSDYVAQLYSLRMAVALSEQANVEHKLRAEIALELGQFMFDIHQYDEARDYVEPVLRMLVDGHLDQPQTLRLCRLSEKICEMVVRDRSTIESTHGFRMCNHCGIIKTGLKPCVCFCVWYCDETCQHAHWPVHKPHCIQCANCGVAKSAMTRCSNCKMTHYCSPDCSKAHWRDHKPHCIAPPAPIEVTVVSCKNCNSVKTTVVTPDAAKTEAK